MAPAQSDKIPRVGLFATARNRRGIISAVEPFDGDSGRLHLVHIEYKDDQLPREERVLWELEPHTSILEPTALPQAHDSDPMPPREFDALLRAARWTAGSPWLQPDGKAPWTRPPISSPFHGAVQIDDFQLVPLLKALRMPRVNLLIADDVGLGKTVEAGLILSELLLRRRIQRVLILTPASLRLQWRDEMWDKFSLPFDLVDRGETYALRKRLGMDANPWRSSSRIIASYHYLRQPGVLDQFLAACRTPEGSPHLPWDLLIVDECHNLMPSAFGEDSDLCQMLRKIAPEFEHRLFLSATPHNGHTRCFTGLLEMLDPVRFSQTSELKASEKARIPEIVLRRLKRDINARTNPPRFCTRMQPKARLLKLSGPEIALSAAFAAFRKRMRSIANTDTGRGRSGSFAGEILGKRLLSCPTAFAESWRRAKAGLSEKNIANDSDVSAAERTMRQETGDDRETQAREAIATGVVGAWLKALGTEINPEIADIDQCLSALGFNLNTDDITGQDPRHDARFEDLARLIDELLRAGKAWRDDERLVIFTEYKTTLDYLLRRLRARCNDDERILTLFGGMDECERDLVKQQFNDPSKPVRILLATDAAAEGLNLQHTARYLLHFDCPWNPSKLEQRNGRIDRHGQGRDVTIHHFVSNDDQDLRFLAHVLHKSDEIREDIGSVNEIFDEAAHRRLVDGDDLETVQRDLDERVELARGRAAIQADATAVTAADDNSAEKDLSALSAELDLDPIALRDTLECAMAINGGHPQLDCSEEFKTCKLVQPSLAGWADVIDESLRRPAAKGQRGALARLAFNADPLMTLIGARQVFVPKPDVLLMHLSHPMIQKALSVLTRRRFPGTGEPVSRWTVRVGGVPSGADALILLSIEELAVNELREAFHLWVRTLAFPVVGGSLQAALPHTPAMDWRPARPAPAAASARAREVYEDAEPQLRTMLREHANGITALFRRSLKQAHDAACKQEQARYESRHGEVAALISENTLAKLEREIETLQRERAQGLLFESRANLDEVIRNKQFEIARRRAHYEEVRVQLDRERKRVLEHLLPKRHALSGEASVFPVCVEIRLPEQRP